jgi:hypothetical protein
MTFRLSRRPELRSVPFPLLIPRTRGEGPSAVGHASLDDSPIVALTKVCYQANDKDWYAYALV